MKRNVIDETIIFYDEGNSTNKNNDWSCSDSLIINENIAGTTLKMTKANNSVYCSPNIVLSGDFEITMDILMPYGSRFLSFGFSDKQNTFKYYKGWWNTPEFQEICIRCIDGDVTYYVNNEFKDSFKLDLNNSFFQFRMYSPNDVYDFSFKNFKIVKLDYNLPLHLLKKIENSNTKIKILNSRLDEQDRIIDSYHRFFNTILVDYKLEPQQFIQNLHQLCLELLIFIDNVCKKYNLEYWLDYGNLLGAIRHGGFIPWDDDMDIGMMRKDFNKFINVIQKEIANYNLEDDIEVIFDFISKKNHIITTIQISYKYEGSLLAGIDVFPYDFLKSYDDNWFGKYDKEQKNHYHHLLNGMPREQLFKNVFEKLNLTYDKADYVSTGIEHAFYFRKKKVVESDMIFPLGEIQFEGVKFPCPNKKQEYVISIYSGDYMEIPKIARFHDRSIFLKRTKDINQKFDIALKKLTEVNEKFN